MNADVGEQSVFDLVPLARAWRQVAHGDGDLQRIGQGLKAHLPQTTPCTVAPSAVGQNQQGIRPGVPCMPLLLPPQSDALYGEVRSVVAGANVGRSEEHTSELQSLTNLVCRLLLEKKKQKDKSKTIQLE